MRLPQRRIHGGLGRLSERSSRLDRSEEKEPTTSLGVSVKVEREERAIETTTTNTIEETWTGVG